MQRWGALNYLTLTIGGVVSDKACGTVLIKSILPLQTDETTLIQGSSVMNLINREFPNAKINLPYAFDP